MLGVLPAVASLHVAEPQVAHSHPLVAPQLSTQASMWRTGLKPWATDPSLEVAAAHWEEQLRGMLSSVDTLDLALRLTPPPKVMVRCYVKRVRNFFGTSVYQMHLDRGGVFLLSARKTKKAATSTYVISREQTPAHGLGPPRARRGEPAVVGKLRANFVGTEYMLTGAPSSDAPAGGVGSSRREHGLAGAGREELCVNFKPHGLRLSSAGPISMSVALPAPESAWSPDEGDGSEGLSSMLDMAKRQELPRHLSRSARLLASRRPEWDESVGGFTLDFNGRVNEFSVKNFQMVSWDADSGQRGSETLLQFGKAGDDVFILDFAYPLSIKTAFAISLAMADTKLCYMLG